MVYLLVDSSGFGGIESHIQQLASLLQSQNVAVEVVFVRYYPGHPQYAQLTNSQLSFRFLSDTSPFRFFRNLAKTDVVHAHGYKAALMARAYRILRSYHLVTSFHAGESLQGKLAVYEWLNRYTCFLSKNLAVSQQILSRIPFRCELLRNFILSDDSNPQRERHEVLQVGFVGRLSHEKGIDRFISLSQAHSDCHFHVFGDGELAALVKEQPSLCWHGAVSSMARYWYQLDVLVISSRAEGLPMAALEAMANGVPVLATNVGDLAALLPEDCVVDESNWQQLSDLIEKLASLSDEQWALLSSQSQQRIMSQYSGESRWPQLARIYQLASRSA